MLQTGFKYVKGSFGLQQIASRRLQGPLQAQDHGYAIYEALYGAGRVGR